MTHYKTGITKGSVQDWILSNCMPGPNGCLEWQGPRDHGGYGVAIVDKVQRHAHRQLMIATIGPMPHALQVCHACDNPCCCNPAHLFIGTAKDNARDAAEKGRLKGGGPVSGCRTPYWKYGSPEQQLQRNRRGAA